MAALRQHENCIPVFAIVFHVELVENHLRESRYIGVQREESGFVGEDAVSPRREGLWERWDLGCHDVVSSLD